MSENVQLAIVAVVGTSIGLVFGYLIERLRSRHNNNKKS